MLIRCRRRGMAAGIAMIFALSVSPALAYVNDITSGLLRAGEPPAVFLAPHDRLYVHYHGIMRVPVSHGGNTRFLSACSAPPALSHDGWLQGLVEAFDTQTGIKDFWDLTLCAWRFKTVKGAKSAYITLAAPLRADLKLKTVALLTKRLIGDQSIAVGGVTHKLKTRKGKRPVSTGTPGAKALLFRKANAVVELKYLGPASFGGPGFLRLGTVINGRLH